MPSQAPVLSTETFRILQPGPLSPNFLWGTQRALQENQSPSWSGFISAAVLKCQCAALSASLNWIDLTVLEKCIFHWLLCQPLNPWKLIEGVWVWISLALLASGKSCYLCLSFVCYIVTFKRSPQTSPVSVITWKILVGLLLKLLITLPSQTNYQVYGRRLNTNSSYFLKAKKYKNTKISILRVETARANYWKCSSTWWDAINYTEYFFV